MTGLEAAYAVPTADLFDPSVLARSYAPVTAYERGVQDLIWSISPPTVAQAIISQDGGTADLQLPVITTDKDLDDALLHYFGARLPNKQCCANHRTPWEAFHDAFFARAPIAVWKGSRGFAGKSFTLALLALAEAIFLRADVNVLGGSGIQSKRLLEHMNHQWEQPNAPRAALRGDPGTEKQTFIWGNTIQALMASQKSVRGPHPQRLRIDECLAVGTRIATPDGWRNIETMTAGDRLYCLDEGQGRITIGTVTAAICRGVRDTISIGWADGSRFTCTPEHPILTGHGWQQAAEATNAKTVPGLRAEVDSHGSTGTVDVHGVLSGEVSSVQIHLPEVRTEKGSIVGRLQNLLSQKAQAIRSAVSRLSEGLSWEPVPVLSFAVDERRRGGTVCGSQGDDTGQTTEQSRTASQGIVDGDGDRVAAPSGHRSVGHRSTGGQDGDRSARGLLARPAPSDRAGQTEAADLGSSRVSGDRTADGPYALVVQAVTSRQAGLSLPVYDLTTTHGTFIAEGVVVHNCDEIKLELLDASLPQPMSKGWVQSHVVLSSTHQYPDGTFTEIMKRAKDKRWPFYEWCYRETVEPHGWLSQAEVERKRSILTVAMWDTEIEGQEPSSEGRAIDTGKVEAAFKADVLLEPPATKQELRTGGEYVTIVVGSYGTGSDWAKKKNHTVIITIRKDVRPMRVVAIKRVQREPWPMMAGYLDQRIAVYGGTSTHDNTGIGQVVHDLLNHDSEPFDMVGRARSDLLSEYVAAIEKGDLVWPKAAENDFSEDGKALHAAYGEHKYATREDLYKGGKDGTSKHHLPDTISAGALAWRAASQAIPTGTTQAAPVEQTGRLNQLRDVTNRMRAARQAPTVQAGERPKADHKPEPEVTPVETEITRTPFRRKPDPEASK